MTRVEVAGYDAPLEADHEPGIDTDEQETWPLAELVELRQRQRVRQDEMRPPMLRRVEEKLGRVREGEGRAGDLRLGLVILCRQ